MLLISFIICSQEKEKEFRKFIDEIQKEFDEIDENSIYK
jgi:hypothetical protein